MASLLFADFVSDPLGGLGLPGGYGVNLCTCDWCGNYHFQPFIAILCAGNVHIISLNPGEPVVSRVLWQWTKLPSLKDFNTLRVSILKNLGIWTTCQLLRGCWHIIVGSDFGGTISVSCWDLSTVNSYILCDGSRQAQQQSVISGPGFSSTDRDLGDVSRRFWSFAFRPGIWAFVPCARSVP